MSSVILGNRRPWRIFPSTLRARLTVWNTFAILLLCILLLFSLRQAVLFTLLREEDQILGEDAIEIGLFVHRGTRWESLQEELERKAEGHAPRKWFSQILNSQGQILASGGTIPPMDFPPLENSYKLVETLSHFRVVQQHYQLLSGEPVTIRVGASLEEIREDVERLTRAMIFVGLGLLVIAPVGGYWLAGRAIRPLAQIIETTSRLRPSHLGERLPLRQTGDELDGLSSTINGFLDRIGDYLAHHRDLVANAAHELRSPLAAMRSSSEVALHQERSVEEYREILGTIIEECSRLGNLVNQLLLLAESDAGRLEQTQQPVQLDRLLHKAIDMFQGVADTQGTSLKMLPSASAQIRGDANHIRQVLFNLIDNALKFTPEGEVTAEIYIEPTSMEAVLVIRDNGKGIPPEDVPRVFERFFRGDKSRSRGEKTGSGLGLSICQAIVSAQGGRITLTSELNRGTTVKLVFPMISS